MFTFFFFLYLFVTDPVLSEYSSSDEEKEAELRKEKILKKFKPNVTSSDEGGKWAAKTGFSVRGIL